jgi:hypothetical protein
VTRQGWAYAAYAAGSTVFLWIALSRGSALLAVGSTLFLLGTLVLLVPKVTSGRGGRPES